MKREAWIETEEFIHLTHLLLRRHKWVIMYLGHSRLFKIPFKCLINIKRRTCCLSLILLVSRKVLPKFAILAYLVDA